MAIDPHGATTDVGATTPPSAAPVPPAPPSPAVAGNGAVTRPGQRRRPDGTAPEASAPPPSRRAARRAARRAPRRGRRVKRVVRRIELWSVLKVALAFYTCMYVVVLAALALLWGLANSAGLVDNFEGFMDDVGFENWQFYGEDMFRRAAAIGAIAVVTTAILTVLATALVNVISELTGGIRFVVIEEEPDPAGRPVARPSQGTRPPRPAGPRIADAPRSEVGDGAPGG